MRFVSKLGRLATAVAAALAAGSAFAAPITPTYTTFGNLAGATYGGSGIPTNPSAITTIVDGANTITLGLIAHQRFTNPALTDDNAGTYFAGAGANSGAPGSPGPYATWNFGFYVSIAGGGHLSDYGFKLIYDFDPAAGNDASGMGVVNLSNVALAAGLSSGSLLQDSQNAAFGYLCAVNPGLNTPPTACPFNPYATGEYSFALTASSGANELGRSAMNVDVIPEPASLALLGLGLAGLGFSRRRKA